MEYGKERDLEEKEEPENIDDTKCDLNINSENKNNQQNKIRSLQPESTENALKTECEKKVKDNVDTEKTEMDILREKIQSLQHENEALKTQFAQKHNDEIKESKRDHKNKSDIPVRKALMLLICVGEYDDQKIGNLPGTQTDKHRLHKLFSEQYQYDVIANQSGRVSKDDFEEMLFSAKKRFRKKKYEYQAIIVLFSGHGDVHSLWLSDYELADPRCGSYRRCDFESYFNGETQNIPEKMDAFKFFIVDACRGKLLSPVQPKEIAASNYSNTALVQSDRSKGSEYVHPAENTLVICSNANKYESYEVPYDEKENDVAFHRLTEDTYMNNDEWPKWCGILMNSVCIVFQDNVSNGFTLNLLQIESRIKRKVKKTVVPIKGDFDCKVGQIAESKDLMDPEEKLKIVITKNTSNQQPTVLWI